MIVHITVVTNQYSWYDLSVYCFDTSLERKEQFLYVCLAAVSVLQG